MNINVHLTTGFVLRLLLIAVGNLLDSVLSIKYTDIDYLVFTDAANHVHYSNSPYKKLTYRYTPLLSWMLLPNVLLNENFGKILFSFFDVICSLLVYSFASAFGKNTHALMAMKLWLYNPFAAIICTRGSAESVMSCLVLSTMYFLQSRKMLIAGLFYGFSVHFKIYPIIFGLLFYITISQDKKFIHMLKPTREQMEFIIGAIIGFGVVTILCFYVYGEDFLYNGFLYHLIRKDTKHNFSVYFYMLYLTTGNSVLNLACFLPQLILIFLVSIKFSSLENLSFAMFLITAIFVTFNKVVTSQYFMWYLSLLPLTISNLKIRKGEGAILVVVWLFAQGSWLLPAYFLEFEGKNTFTYIWVESLAFMCSNVGILGRLIKSYDFVVTN